jgi:hypothetical protein
VSGRRARAWWLFAGAIVLLAGGWFVLGFLDEPSAVDRVRALLIAIGGGAIALGLAAAAAGVWMLVGRRT